MAQTFNIPLVTLRSGSQSTTFALSPGISLIDSSFNRTVGHNPLDDGLTFPSGRKFTLDLQLSYDGGVTFRDIGGYTVNSGIEINDDGTINTIDTCEWSGFTPSPDHVKVNLNVVGTISVSGSVTLS